MPTWDFLCIIIGGNCSPTKNISFQREIEIARELSAFLMLLQTFLANNVQILQSHKSQSTFLPIQILIWLYSHTQLPVRRLVWKRFWFQTPARIWYSTGLLTFLKAFCWHESEKLFFQFCKCSYIHTSLQHCFYYCETPNLKGCLSIFHAPNFNIYSSIDSGII